MHEISGTAQKIVGALCRAPSSLCPDDKNAPIRETFLLADLIVVPAGGVELRQNVSASVIT
jgi:hypothetical protein